MTDPSEYGRGVRARRKLARLTMAALADLACVHPKTVANVEAGHGCNQGTRRLIEQALARARKPNGEPE